MLGLSKSKIRDTWIISSQMQAMLCCYVNRYSELFMSNGYGDELGGDVYQLDIDASGAGSMIRKNGHDIEKRKDWDRPTLPQQVLELISDAWVEVSEEAFGIGDLPQSFVDGLPWTLPPLESHHTHKAVMRDKALLECQGQPIDSSMALAMARNVPGLEVFIGVNANFDLKLAGISLGKMTFMRQHDGRYRIYVAGAGYLGTEDLFSMAFNKPQAFRSLLLDLAAYSSRDARRFSVVNAALRQLG